VESGNVAAALPLLEQASETFHHLHFRQLEGWFTILQALAHVTAGDAVRAAASLARGEEIVCGVTFTPAVVEARLVEGLIARARGATEQAERTLGDALAVSERLGARFFAARVRLVLAELAAARGDAAAATHHLDVARSEFQAVGAPVWAERAAAGTRRLDVGSPHS
jgi:ATP/maltotriose-dependent transcriptional regulator MalT